jgi:hypothetical protein
VQKKDITRSMNSESNDAADLNVDNPINTEQGVKVVGKSLRSLSFRERMRHLSSHCRSLKERMKDKTVPYVDLFRFLRQEGTTKNNPKHIGGQKHKNIVDRHSKYAILNI